MSAAESRRGTWWWRRLLPVLAAGAALLVAAAPALALSDADKADVQRIEQYLNRMDTVRARFFQRSSDNTFAEGNLYLWRPGRMRIEYDPPTPILIVADGTFLIYFDKSLEQVSYLGLDATPAGILLRETVSFSGDLEVTAFERGAGVLRVTVVQAKDPLAGSITMVFADDPLILRKWTVTDAQGVITEVSLLGARFGVELDPELFRFKDPTRFREPGSGN